MRLLSFNCFYISLQTKTIKPTTMTKIIKLSIFVAVTVLFILTSCEKIKENLAVTVPINDRELTFEVGTNPLPSTTYKAPAATAELKVLLDKTFNVNVEAEVEKLGYDMNNIVEFFLSVASIELVEPIGFNMNEFSNIKVYFDDQTQLIAQVDKIENGKVKFTIVNGNLLQKLKSDQLHVIIVGDNMPSKRVKLKLKTSYKAKFNLLK